MTKNRIITICCMAAAILLSSCGSKQKQESKPEAEWTQLFNGENFDGWEKFLGTPIKGHEEAAKDATPDNVFSIAELDGQKVIHISGVTFGSLATKQTFRNFHARMVMKWGESKTSEFNCGFLYYGHGPFGAGFGTWKSSVECQLCHGNMGGLYVIGDDVSLKAETQKQGEDYKYTKGAEPTVFSKEQGPRAILGGVDAEKPMGEWNTIEIYCVGNKTVHVVNGQVTMRTDSLTTTAGGKVQPLEEGCLQLQSEGGELYVKSVEIQNIDAIPEELLK